MGDYDTGKTYDEEVRLDEDYITTPEMSFSPYINKSKVDLTPNIF